MAERLAALAAALVFCGWAVSLLVGGKKSVAVADSEATATDKDGTPEGEAAPKDKPEDDQARTGWRWRTARRDSPPIVTVERVGQPHSEPQPPAPDWPALRAVPDPAPDPEGLDPMSIARRAYELARTRRRQQATKAARVVTATGNVIPLQGRATTTVVKQVDRTPVPTALVEVPGVALNAPAAGQMMALVETIAESAMLLARIPPGGDIRNPIAQIAAFAQAQAALAHAVAEHRVHMARDRHDGIVLAFAEQADAITHTAATSLAETAVAATIRYRGTAADQAAGTSIPNVNRH